MKILALPENFAPLLPCRWLGAGESHCLAHRYFTNNSYQDLIKNLEPRYDQLYTTHT